MTAWRNHRSGMSPSTRWFPPEHREHLLHEAVTVLDGAVERGSTTRPAAIRFRFKSGTGGTIATSAPTRRSAALARHRAVASARRQPQACVDALDRRPF